MGPDGPDAWSADAVRHVLEKLMCRLLINGKVSLVGWDFEQTSLFVFRSYSPPITRKRSKRYNKLAKELPPIGPPHYPAAKCLSQRHK